MTTSLNLCVTLVCLNIWRDVTTSCLGWRRFVWYWWYCSTGGIAVTHRTTALWHKFIAPSCCINKRNWSLFWPSACASMFCGLTFYYSSSWCQGRGGSKILGSGVQISWECSICAVWPFFSWNSPWKWNNLGSRGGKFKPPNPLWICHGRWSWEPWLWHSLETWSLFS